LLGAAASRRPAVAGAEAEAAVRQLAAELATLSFRHAAAIRLRGHEAPPSVSTDRFTQAMQFQAPALDKAWRVATGSLATTRHAPR
jgi:hypothetical protein